MDSKIINRLHYFVIIAGQKQKNKFITLLSEHGGHIVDVVYGKGSADTGLWASTFGFEVEEGKALLSCLIPVDKSADLIKVLYNDYGFKKPNTGVAFAVPVEGLAF